MMTWKTAGTYLGKPVWIARWNEGNSLPVGALDTAVLLLVFGSVVIPYNSLRSVLRLLIEQDPMAMVIAGIDARRAFDVLIEQLSDRSSRFHVMTKLMDGERIDMAIEEFFLATWPSDDRFDNWTSYCIIDIGATEASSSEHHVAAFLER